MRPRRAARPAVLMVGHDDQVPGAAPARAASSVWRFVEIDVIEATDSPPHVSAGGQIAHRP